MITLAEIEYGMEAKNWGATSRDLMRRFLTRFTLLLPDTETAHVWARIKRGCETQGRPITFADAWIAAAALQLNVPLVTHNARDYRAVDKLTILTASSASSTRKRGYSGNMKHALSLLIMHHLLIHFPF
ncbi:MAG TPA: PIN domain-containing protein [Candidatus Acidoferrales bacterium]|nr:PIN domain-containing protein [Candidatus Acidoferrales bacterium]